MAEMMGATFMLLNKGRKEWKKTESGFGFLFHIHNDFASFKYFSCKFFMYCLFIPNTTVLCHAV
jgi:hypothetical protein